MGRLEDMLHSGDELSRADARWLSSLVADWQLIADLAFSDLVLWLPAPTGPSDPQPSDSQPGGVMAVAQVRPTTGPTALLEDVVGVRLPAEQAPAIGRALQTGEVVDDGVSAWATQFVPVRRDGRTIAVVQRQREAPGLRSAGALEAAYLDVATELLEMIRTGDFPESTDRAAVVESMRVGDGFVRTGADGLVRFASPNALSAYRRLGLVGDLVGTRLVDVTASLMDRRTPRHAVPGLMVGLDGGSGELENENATLHVRRIALQTAGTGSGALLLLRDVTELRSRERELMTKDATIREIHHRVKNNLQTVAALLRLQGRRMSTEEARLALSEAETRVGSIALVHETLSQSFGDTVDFDIVADRLLRTVLDVSAHGGERVATSRIGSFGQLSGDVTTPLAMVLTELLQNAAEHAFTTEGGQIVVTVSRVRDRIRLRVSDDGRGLPEAFGANSGSLGLSIVRTLVQTELHGTLTFETRSEGGTTVSISFEA